MRIKLLIIILFICTIQTFHSQEENDGVVALALPVRNSLTFNRFALNPTFTFVREQHKYINISNKREWTQFEDAPLTYLGGYTGRFAENIGAGLSLFQQNYGVLTTFGGVANFAYNARINRDNNLTFGLNVGAYSSGVNTGNVVSNVDDPALQNAPKNTLLTLSPGINYGTAFFDFGLAINNLAAYNFETSEMLQDNPEQGIQAHIMYTGYMSSRGFFDEAKFTGLIRSEFKNDETVISGVAMLTIPKGIWAQVGYNTVFGASGGIGINITSEIALEYNYEMAVGDLAEFGSSHDFTLAYRFKNKQRYDYNDDDEVAGLLSGKKKSPILASAAKAKAKAKREKAQKDAEAQARLLAEQKAKEDTEAQARLLAEQKAKEDAEAQARLLAEQKAKEEAEAQARLLAEQKAKEDAEAQARLLAEQKAKEEAEAQARLLAEQKAKEEADEQARLLAEQKAKEEAEAQARLLAEQKAKEDAEAQARLLAEQKAKEEAEAQARLLAEQKAKEDAEAQARLLAEQKAKEEDISSQITNPTDDFGKAMKTLAEQTEETKSTQRDLLQQFDDMVAVKNQDLKDLKEENDLSEQGIAVQPKPFKSITEENNRLNAIKSNLDNIINSRNEKINQLKELYDDKFEADTIYNEEVYLYYRKTIQRLETEQKEAIDFKNNLETRLADIKVATEFERRRRIKRAAFDNEDERYSLDRSTLQNIKETTTVTNALMKESDFDFGEPQSDNIQILKNVTNVENGYYLVLAVHTDVNKRNEFIRKVVSTGKLDVDFFYDVNTSKYYIYDKKYSSIQAANQAMETKGNKSYNTKMSLVKIEN